MRERIREKLRSVIDCFRFPEDVEAKEMFARADGIDNFSRGKTVKVKESSKEKDRH